MRPAIPIWKGGAPVVPEFHPLADIFPLMEGAAFDELVESVGRNGLNHPIVMHEGKILDGRNRWRACKRLGIESAEVPYEGNDPARFVWEENAVRRQLTPGQLALAAERYATAREGGYRAKDQTDKAERPSQNDQAQTREDVARVTGASIKGIERARRVRRQGLPEVVAAVERGDLAISTAARIATKPEAEQREIVMAPVSEWPKAAPDPRWMGGEAVSGPPVDVTAPRPILTSHGRRMPQRSQREAMTAGLSTLKGLCAGFESVEEIEPGITAEEATRWARDLSDAISVLNKILRKVRNHGNSTASDGD
jgi:ParB-like chromosome segregation protein Spo0J